MAGVLTRFLGDDPTTTLLRRWIGVDNPDIDAANIIATCDKYLKVITSLHPFTSQAYYSYPITISTVANLGFATAIGALCAAINAYYASAEDYDTDDFNKFFSTRMSSAGYSLLSAAIAYLGANGLALLAFKLDGFIECAKTEMTGKELVSDSEISTIAHASKSFKIIHIKYYTKYGSVRSAAMLFYLHVTDGNFVEAEKYLQQCQSHAIDLDASKAKYQLLLDHGASPSLIRKFCEVTGFEYTEPFDDTPVKMAEMLQPFFDGCKTDIEKQIMQEYIDSFTSSVMINGKEFEPICPITGSLIVNPVKIVENGRSFYFEESALRKWWRLNPTNPCTQTPLEEGSIKEAPEMKQAIREALDKALRFKTVKSLAMEEIKGEQVQADITGLRSRWVESQKLTDTSKKAVRDRPDPSKLKRLNTPKKKR